MLIGISGKKGSGKDVAADYLVLNYGFKKISFADPIKEALKVIFGWDNSILYSNKKNEVDKEFGLSPRIAMQTLGTDWGQFMLIGKGEFFKETINRKLWVKTTFKNIEKNKYKNVVIPDVRFLHEAEEIKCRGGEIIKIERPPYTIKDDHISENEMDIIEFDSILLNDLSINDFQERIKTYLKTKGF